MHITIAPRVQVGILFKFDLVNYSLVLSLPLIDIALGWDFETQMRLVQIDCDIRVWVHRHLIEICDGCRKTKRILGKPAGEHFDCDFPF